MVKVLIVDDSILVRERLAGLLSELGNVEWVDQAGNGGEALDAIQRSRPDVVILDIRMPKGNGMQVLEAIKRGPGSPVVIVLTAFPFPQYRKKCLEAGADFFFDKSSEFGRIAEVLEQLRDQTNNHAHP